MKDYTQRVAPKHNYQESIDVPTVQPIYINSGGTAVVIIVMFMFSVIILGALYRDSDSAITGILASVPVFLAGTPILIMAVNGGITRIVCLWIEQVTIRRQDASLMSLSNVTAGRSGTLTVLPEQSHADPLLPASNATRFIAAVPRVSYTTKAVAASWVAQLFDTSTGQPLPMKITRQKGNIQLKSPEPEIVDYLLSLGIVAQDEGKHLFWNRQHFPTYQEAINAIRRGIRIPSTDEDKDGWEGGS